MTRISAARGSMILLFCLMLPAPSSGQEPDVVLTGELSGDDHQSYRMLPFRVPAGVDRIVVVFTYDRTAKTTIDLGLEDPQRFRGWSGGNKSTFTVAETDATPSYLPGPLPAGEWQLVLGVPNIRRDVSASYRAEISFLRGAAAFTRPFADAPPRADPGWYRGDLHVHSGHSDGACGTQSGGRAPCPLYRTVEAAAARGLDFIAVTEHNARSHHQGLRELQGVFDRLVLIPGRELTTFHGHANVLGTTGYFDFRLSASDMDAALAAAIDIGGLVSINHPALPSGERCMGCGWTANVNPGRVQAMEVVNGATLAAAGGQARHPYSGLPRWEAWLNQGFRITAVAGSDNHDPLVDPHQPSAVGHPVSVVYATELSQPALLEGIRKGRVFIDLEGSAGRLLDIEVSAESRTAAMGETFSADAGSEVTVAVTAQQVADGQIVLIRNGAAVGPPGGISDGESLHARFRLTATGTRGWLRAEVVAPDGRLLLLSNPVYLNFPEADADRRTPG